MADLKNLSDQELLALRAQPSASPLSQMSDAELLAARVDTKKPMTLADTWPARLAKSVYSAAKLPGDVYSGEAQLPSLNGVPGSAPPDAGERTLEPNGFAQFLGADPKSRWQAPAEGSPMGRAVDLAGLGPTAPRVGATIKPSTAGAPSVEQLESSASTRYNAPAVKELQVHSDAAKNFGATITADLEQTGINAELAPKTFSILGKLNEPPSGSFVTASNFETLRRTLGNAARDFTNPTEQKAATQAIRHLDNYLAELPAADVAKGDAKAVAAILSDARGDYAAARRSQTVTGALETADGNAAAANSGQNIGNAIRQRFNSILKSDKQSSGFKPDEISQMERVRDGTVTGNTTRFAGNMLGGGGGLGAIITAGIGGAATAPWGGVGAALPAVGYALKKFSDMSVRRQAEILDEMVRSNSPLGQSAPKALYGPGEMTRAQARLLLSGARPEQD